MKKILILGLVLGAGLFIVSCGNLGDFFRADGLSMPNADWDGNTFTLPGIKISANGTYFSVLAEGGTFESATEEIDGARFDMAILENGEDYIDSNFTSNTPYTYVQFKATEKVIATSAMEAFIKALVFAGSDVTVSIGIESVSVADVADAEVTYFNGSFYKYAPFMNSSFMTWIECYEAAKEEEFNGLPGYLFVVTSEAENRFIYDRILKPQSKTKAWIGGTRFTNGGKYDEDTWTDDETKGDKWVWACGPEAGEVYYETATKDDTKSIEMYHSWSHSEPNDYGSKEECMQYTSSYFWNDISNYESSTSNASEAFVVEFTAYKNEFKEASPSNKSTYNFKNYQQ